MGFQAWCPSSLSSWRILTKKTIFVDLLMGIAFLSPSALLNARTNLDELGTDNLCLPTATTSLAWARTPKSTGISGTRSAITDSTRGCMVHDLGPRRATVDLSRGDLPSS
ncbi:hypothetical protein BD779DRAFT_927840 [Infundibulicybe gibba]|nr:hypothetical protein BD779DRAFT_927840 [Infundibulicybe gibba]